MNTPLTLNELNQIFDLAETYTASEFNNQTCSMRDRHGNDSCPICFFRKEVKRLLAERQYLQVEQ